MNDPLQHTLAQLVDQLAERVAHRLDELQQDQRDEADSDRERSPWLGIERAAAYLDWPKGRLYKLTASGGIPTTSTKAASSSTAASSTSGCASTPTCLDRSSGDTCAGNRASVGQEEDGPAA